MLLCPVHQDLSKAIKVYIQELFWSPPHLGPHQHRPVCDSRLFLSVLLGMRVAEGLHGSGRPLALGARLWDRGLKPEPFGWWSNTPTC